MKIYIYQTYKIEEKRNGVINHTLIAEGALDYAEGVSINRILPGASNDASDLSLSGIQDFLDENYPGHLFRYQEHDIDYSLSTDKVIRGLYPKIDGDVRSIGSGVLLSPQTYAAIILGATIKDMSNRAYALANLLEYFNVTPHDIEICQSGYLNNEEKFSWEKQS